MITTAASLSTDHVRGTTLNDALEFTYFNLHNNATRRYHYALLLQIKKWRRKEGKQFVQGHRALSAEARISTWEVWLQSPGESSSSLMAPLSPISF